MDAVTSTVPEPGGEVAEHEVSKVQLTVVPADPPKSTVRLAVHEPGAGDRDRGAPGQRSMSGVTAVTDGRGT